MEAAFQMLQLATGHYGGEHARNQLSIRWTTAQDYARQVEDAVAQLVHLYDAMVASLVQRGSTCCWTKASSASRCSWTYSCAMIGMHAEPLPVLGLHHHPQPDAGDLRRHATRFEALADVMHLRLHPSALNAIVCWLLLLVCCPLRAQEPTPDAASTDSAAQIHAAFSDPPALAWALFLAHLACTSQRW